MTTLSVEPETSTSTSVQTSGSACAVMLSSGIGAFLIGAATVAASASPAVKKALDWWPPAGPLTGKALLGVFAWLFFWGILHMLWKGRPVSSTRVMGISLALIVLSLVMTFPPVFEAFEH